VRGNDEIIHRINGVEVLRYQRPQLDPTNNNAPATDQIEAGGNTMLSYGHIALQAEGQPVWFQEDRAELAGEEVIKASARSRC